MKKLIAIVGFMVLSASTVTATSWEDFIYNAEGDIIEFTVLRSIAPSYFYNAFSGRSEVGATTEVFWVGTFVSADVGFSVPNAEDTNRGTVILGGNLHIDKLIAHSFPNKVAEIKSYFPTSINKFWKALKVGVYVGHETTESQLAGGVYSGLELKF